MIRDSKKRNFLLVLYKDDFAVLSQVLPPMILSIEKFVLDLV